VQAVFEKVIHFIMASLFFKHLYIGPEPFEKSNMLKIRRTLRCAWLWPCILASAAPISGGAADPSGSPFIVDSWNNQQGLPQSSVISIIQTRDGYLWLGTLNGLVRFDGSHFAVFDENNTPGMRSARVVRLFEDSHTNFWVGTDTAGVALIGNGTLTNFSIGRSGHEGRLTPSVKIPTARSGFIRPTPIWAVIKTAKWTSWTCTSRPRQLPG
jgi:Two component regulator propeller